MTLPLGAAPDSLRKLACGSPRSAAETLLLARQRSLAAPQGEFRPSAQIRPAAPTSVDGIALVEATSEVLAPPHPFDLAHSSVRITPERGRYRVRAARTPQGAPLEAAGRPLDIGDDDFARIELPFSFPFYGSFHDQLYVNSDGNLTFLSPEASSQPRTYSRAAYGPPRIAPLFRDVDPSRAGSVRVTATSDLLTVAWSRVPLYSDTTLGVLQSFQVTIWPDGSIEFRYGAVDLPGAVVGLFSGDALSDLAAIDFSAGRPALVPADSIVAEVFSSEPSIDEFAVLHSFYRSHEDAYDSVVVFNDLDMDASEFSLAHAYTVRNEVRGIGEPIYDSGPVFGSARRLSLFVNMGALSQYPPYPAVPIPSLPHASLLTVLAHEIGHRFLAYTPYQDPVTGLPSNDLLGRQLAHWSFFFNSHASVLEGNSIRDHGPHARPRFETVAASLTYSPLDQYLMGLRDPSEVPPTFLVTDPVLLTGPAGSGARSPEVGVEFDGIRKAIEVQHIIDAVGERRPASSVAQRHFRHALVLLVGEGAEPSPQSLWTLARLRRWWPAYFDLHLGSRATASLDLVRMLHSSTWPATGLLAGATGAGRLMIETPRYTDLVVNLRLDPAIAEIPATVTIPAGKVEADFETRGLVAGAATLTAEAAEPGYDRAVSRLAVRADASELVLEALHLPEQFGIAGSSPGAPLAYLVRDEDFVPYSGVEIDYSASGEGAPGLEPSRTDAFGQAQVAWVLDGASGDQTLTAQIRGAPDSAVQTQALVSESGPLVLGQRTANAASGETAAGGRGFARGSLVTIFGRGLATGHLEADTLLRFDNPSLPTLLDGTSVHVGGVAVPLTSVSPTQITLQLPFVIVGNVADIVVSSPFGRAGPVTVPLGIAQPGIFPDRVGSGAQAAVSDPDTPPQSALPRAGGLLELYATGLGAVSPAGRAGRAGLSHPPQRVVAGTRAWVDNQSVEVTFSGLSSFEAGVYVVTLNLPRSLAPGDHTVRIAVGGRGSNSVGFESQ